MPVIASSKWRMLAQRTPIEPLPKGLDAAWDVGMGLVDRVIPRRKRFLLQVERILSIEKEFSNLTDARLREHAEDFRRIFRCNRDSVSDVERAFAFVREVAFRQIGEDVAEE